MISLHIYYFAIFFCKDRFFFFLFKMEGVQKIKFLSDFEQKKKKNDLCQKRLQSSINAKKSFSI